MVMVLPLMLKHGNIDLADSFSTGSCCRARMRLMVGLRFSSVDQYVFGTSVMVLA
jgi:hypothetical protein